MSDHVPHVEPEAFADLPLVCRASENRDTFATLIRTWRQSRKLTQRELAAKIGECQRDISQIESGDRQPSRCLITRLAAALDVPPSDQEILHNLLGYSYEPTQDALPSSETEIADAVDAYLDSLVDDQNAFIQDVFDESYRIVRMNLVAAFLAEWVLPPDADVFIDGKISWPLMIVHPEGITRFTTQQKEHVQITFAKIARARVADPERFESLYDRMKQVADNKHIPKCEFADVPESADLLFSFWFKNKSYTIDWLEVVLDGHDSPFGLTLPNLSLATGTPADPTSARVLEEILADAQSARDSIRPEFRYALTR